jgi:hypothetical protein
MYNSDMDTYASTIETPIALTYDPAIYWLEPHAVAQVNASQEILKDVPNMTERLSYELGRVLARETASAGWAHYTVVEQPFEDDFFRNIRTFRRHAHEQPGFTKIHRYAGPPRLMRLRIQPPQGKAVDLELRRVMWHGRRERAALHGTELYVVYADIKPEARGGITDT